MQKFNIAVASKANAIRWVNKEVTFTELVDKLKNTIVTNETIDEYKSFNKLAKQQAKDHGGFIGGKLKGTKRRNDEILFRSMLTLDVDNGEVGFIERFKNECKYKAILYSTHSYEPARPRVRIIVPLSRNVDEVEFIALSRLFANEWGIEQFDPCSFVISQMMFYPSTPKDIHYVFEVVDKDYLNPDEYLANYPNYKDLSSLPKISKEVNLSYGKGKKLKDPLEKEGLVGAFCRAYSISEVIKEYLRDIYEESDNGKYQYIPSSSIAGVKIYDDKFAHSFHATDPAYGKSLNAFDLVRAHLFKEDDEKTSIKKMYELIKDDERVKTQLFLEKQESINEDFKVEEDNNFYSKLEINQHGRVANTTSNLILILKNDVKLKDFALNQLANQVEVIGNLPWDRPKNNRFWRDFDEAQLKAYLDKHYCPFSTRNYDIGFKVVIDDRGFHPIKEYLDNLPEWDKVKRVENIFIKYLNADDNDYTKTITRKVFTAAVTRIYEPGCKFDAVLVLDGNQGVGKSSLIKDLCLKEYFCDSLTLTDVTNGKDAQEKIEGYWIVEIQELAGMKKAEIEKVKAFISCQNDMFRRSYGRVVESHPRQCVIFATVNGDRGYLRDITGNRRFWILKIHKESKIKDWNFTSEFLAQFWAEAKYYYLHHEKLYLEGDILNESKLIQASVMEHDDRLGIVEEYLNTLLPPNWDNLELKDRRAFLNKDEFFDTHKEGTIKRTTVSNAEIWCECFNKDLSSMKKSDSYELSSIMEQIPGWTRTNRIKKLSLYGRQRLYVKG